MPCKKPLRKLLFLCCILASSAGIALTQSAGPQPLPMPAPIAAPKDVPYTGTLQLDVDATDIARHIFNVHETVPMRVGDPIVLLYPQWLPGNHSPSGQADMVAGLMISANGAPVAWTPDPVNLFAFHVNVPSGATTVDVRFQFTSPIEGNEGRVVMTPDMLNLEWPVVALYPAGYFARQIMVEASVRLPEEWQFATALETASSSGGAIKFKPVSFDTLVDSPIIAGRYFKRLDLDPGGAVSVHLDIVADRAEQLEVKPEPLEAHRVLVQRTLLDRTIAVEPADYLSQIKALNEEAVAADKAQKAKFEAERIPNAKTTLDLDAYTGDYFHPAYGTVHVVREGDQLVVKFDAMDVTLKHYHYDTFESDQFGTSVAQFRLGDNGKVSELLLPLEPAVKPFSFVKK